MENRTHIAIDLKSFYASVECMERGLDPMTTNLPKMQCDGAANALICAEIAFSGAREIIPFYEMVTAMYQVGMRMST